MQFTGEQLLLWAVLEDARRCLHGQVTGETNPRIRRRIIRDAHDWMMDDNAWGAFSFSAICHVFKLAPDGVRRWMLTDVTPPTLGHRVRAMRVTAAA